MLLCEVKSSRIGRPAIGIQNSKDVYDAQSEKCLSSASKDCDDIVVIALSQVSSNMIIP